MDVIRRERNREEQKEEAEIEGVAEVGKRAAKKESKKEERNGNEEEGITVGTEERKDAVEGDSTKKT